MPIFDVDTLRVHPAVRRMPKTQQEWERFIKEINKGDLDLSSTSVTELTDIGADPGADSLLLWDDSETGSEGTWITSVPDSFITESSVTQHEAAIDHDALTNFVSNEHIDHTSVTLTAGNGLSGGGDISANRSFAVDLNELGTEVSIAAGDFLAMVDITDNGSQKITFANLESALNHDSLTGFVSNEHIDHTSVTLTAGNGLSGGGDISANRSFAVDLNELGTETSIASGDFLAMVDITDSGSQKITFANLEAALNHDSLTGFVANEHIDWTSASSNFSTTGTLSAGPAGAKITASGTEIDLTATTLDFNGNADISGSLTVSSANYMSGGVYSFVGDTDTYMYRSGANQLAFVTGGATRVTIDSAEIDLNATTLDFNGIIDNDQGVALGAGSTATLGTIGGSGPTSTGQAQWLQIQISGTTHWIPVWT